MSQAPKWCNRHAAPVSNACDESCVYTSLPVGRCVPMHDPTYYKAKPTCGLCGVGIGPDTTGRPMCYGCGPAEMRPPLWTSPHHCGEGSACLGPCDPRSRFDKGAGAAR
jgi:hypothetical protein